MRFLDRWRSTIAITVDGHRARCVKGKVSAACLAEIHSLLDDHGINSAELYLAGDGRLSFSSEIPRHLHQALRNLVLGHHNPS